MTGVKIEGWLHERSAGEPAAALVDGSSHCRSVRVAARALDRRFDRRAIPRDVRTADEVLTAVRVRRQLLGHSNIRIKLLN
jgi:hypothetical protein